MNSRIAIVFVVLCLPATIEAQEYSPQFREPFADTIGMTGLSMGGFHAHDNTFVAGSQGQLD